MPTLSELSQILIASRIVGAARWQRAVKRGGGNLGGILDALADEPPEWWSESEGGDPPPGLTDYQRGLIELWVEDDSTDLGRQLAVNQFLLLDKLGEGGQGAVFRARQLNPGRFVAVKTLTQDSEARRLRFEQEARAMMKIQHPAVARFHLYERVRDAAGVPTDEYLIAMEFVEGNDLSRLIHSCGRLPWTFVAQWAVQLLDGLALIHKHGFIHRDIKPANVMILGPVPEPEIPFTETAAKLLDFGAVKPTADDSGSTGGRRVFVGTREYAPPEQWGETVVPTSDIYALGATLFYALAGQPPYVVEGRDAIAFMKAHAHAPIPDVTDFNPTVPEGLNNLLRRMLAKDPDDRGSAAELAREFRRLLTPGAKTPAAIAPPPARKEKAAASRPARASTQERAEPTGFAHAILAALERVYLPRSLRPAPGHEPPAPERLAALLRRPLVLATILVLLGVLIFLIVR